ncbi:MAG TPA: 30S ribosome-binding factor RbfA [Steroidobacteraceae bacterium]|jgi:ribosome-binding factor A|nr:30S ribosome-binding factor RbfA [Steroidobacteraceae bacterium]
MSESKPRHRRIEGEMQRALSELVAREVKDPRVGSITVTDVKVTSDLSIARVFFVPFASKHSAEEVQAGLTSAGAYLRGEVGRRLRLRHAPRLEFVFDDSIDRAAKLTALIDSAPK